MKVNFIKVKCTNFFVRTLFWQLFSSYMYVVKAAKTMFVQKIWTFNVDEIDTFGYAWWKTTLMLIKSSIVSKIGTPQSFTNKRSIIYLLFPKRVSYKWIKNGHSDTHLNTGSPRDSRGLCSRKIPRIGPCVPLLSFCYNRLIASIFAYYNRENSVIVIVIIV